MATPVTFVEAGGAPVTLVDAGGLPISASQSLSRNASRILAATQRPLGDISAVMGSPPTITNPVSDAANSTIGGMAPALGNGQYKVTDPTKITVFGGPLDVNNRINTVSLTVGNRTQGHSSGIAFRTDAQVFDFCSRFNGGPNWVGYVTDVDGTRKRMFTSDRAMAYAGYNWYKIDLGSAATSGRLIEIYGSLSGNWGGVNVPAGYAVWAADELASQPKLLMFGDSYISGNIGTADVGLQMKLAMPDWFAGVFGCNNPFCSGLGSTGALATNGGAAPTFGQRIAAGDVDALRIGYQDLVTIGGSVNDSNTSYGGLAIPAGDAAVQDAYKAVVSALMVAQPTAIIVGWPQEFSSAGAATPSRVAAYKAGFLAAAGSNPRMIWLDGTLFESAPSTGVVAADNVHPFGPAGARHIGERLARQTISSIRLLAA